MQTNRVRAGDERRGEEREEGEATGGQEEAEVAK